MMLGCRKYGTLITCDYCIFVNLNEKIFAAIEVGAFTI